MQKQDFGEKAQKLYERLASLSTPLDHRKQSMPETLNTSGLRPHTKYSQTISDLMKFEHDLCSDEQSNCKKIKQLNQEIKKMESYLNQENESRIKINEHFIHNTLKMEKNMQNALEGVKRVYGQREKKMEDKLEQIIKAEKKILEQHIDDDDDIENEMHRMNEDLNKIKEQLTTMKKNRIELEDKIYTQFSQQMKELRTIFNKTNQKREQRETKVLSALKRLYKKTMDSLRSEEVNRQASEKLFLSVIEKLIDRIKAYKYNMMLWGEKEKMDINLSKFLCGIGQICPICKSRLKSYEAISICCCFLFTHEACIVKVLEPLVQPNRDFLCSHCSYKLKVKAKMSYSYEPRLSCSQLCAFIIGLLCILFITLLTLFGVYDRILPHTWCLIIAGFFATLLFLLFLYTIRKLVIKDLTIIPTNLLNKSQKVSIDFTYQREQGVQSIV